jgi:hypothetical protein
MTDPNAFLIDVIMLMIRRVSQLLDQPFVSKDKQFGEKHVNSNLMLLP